MMCRVYIDNVVDMIKKVTDMCRSSTGYLFFFLASVKFSDQFSTIKFLCRYHFSFSHIIRSASFVLHIWSDNGKCFIAE